MLGKPLHEKRQDVVEHLVRHHAEFLFDFKKDHMVGEQFMLFPVQLEGGVADIAHHFGFQRKMAVQIVPQKS